MPGGTATDAGGRTASRGGPLHDALLDQPLPLGGPRSPGGGREPVKAELQPGSTAEGGRGVPVWPGQQHGHRGKVQAAVWKSCIGVGEGVSLP